ncbi:MAG: hypothetical protein V1761_02070 [bacterium]
MKKSFFLFFAFLTLFAVMACTPVTTATTATTTGTGTTTTMLDYDDFGTLANYDEVFTLSDITYLVYMYSPECHNCITLKPEMLAFAAAYGEHNIFFFDVSGAVFGDRDAFLYTVDKTQMLVPFLILVKDNGYFGSYLGTNEIRAGIQAITAGTLSDWE